MKLLVVEDDAKIATSLKRGLEAEGFAVEIASNGDDGLDLAITRDVIQRHAGTIGVDPEYERGTRFRVTLPLVGASPGAGS